MNKKNKILVGCLSLLLVLSVGYALFGQTITINGTATAKGELELTTTALTDDEIDSIWGLYDSGIITDSNIDVVGNEVTTNVTLGAPGSTKMFVFKVENTGTIPAYLKSITDKNGNAITSGRSSVLAGGEKANLDNTSIIAADLFIERSFDGDYEDEYWGVFHGGSTVDEISQYVLDPGEIIYFSIESYWTKNSTSGETLSLSWTFNLNWEQAIAQ